jgi:DNA-binding transcriptional LysR family regulator
MTNLAGDAGRTEPEIVFTTHRETLLGVAYRMLGQVADAEDIVQATGPGTRVRVRILAGDEARTARRLIERKHPWLYGLLVPLGHRLTGKKTVYLELRPKADNGAQTTATDAAA